MRKLLVLADDFTGGLDTGAQFAAAGIPTVVTTNPAYCAAGTRFYSEIGVILGIILSMLLASLSILCNYDFSEVRDEQQRKKGRDVVKTTINVVFFDVLMCVFLLLYGLVIIVLSDGDYTWLHIDITLLKVIISAVSYYVFSIIMLNLLLVVKQISRIIEFNLIVKKKTE